MKKRKKAGLVVGDGIGLEICQAVMAVFEAAEVPVDFVEIGAGLSELEKNGTPISHQSIELLKELGVALKGPTTTPSGTGHRSVNVHIRKKLGLFVNVRPAMSIRGISPMEDVDLVIVRENLEDTYGGVEYMLSDSVAEGSKLTSTLASKQCSAYALELAKKLDRKRVTCVHKANIHKFTDGLFLKSFKEMAQSYEGIVADDILVDSLCLQLVRTPGKFDVLVAPNLYGDIISDLAAGLVGGLGIAPAANLGRDVAIFEAVHGSAPDIAGKNEANPTALMLSSVMFLEYLGLQKHADNIAQALRAALEDGHKTKDLGGALSTSDFAKAVISKLSKLPSADTMTSRRGLMEITKALGHAELPPFVSEVENLGVDVYVKSSSVPIVPKQIVKFKLSAIGNRGLKITGSDVGILNLTDVYCLRFLVEAGFEPAELQVLLTELQSLGINWVTLKKLYTLASGAPSYSELE